MQNRKKRNKLILDFGLLVLYIDELVEIRNIFLALHVKNKEGDTNNEINNKLVASGGLSVFITVSSHFLQYSTTPSVDRILYLYHSIFKLNYNFTPPF